MRALVSSDAKTDAKHEMSFVRGATQDLSRSLMAAVKAQLDSSPLEACAAREGATRRRRKPARTALEEERASVYLFSL
jgi:hypothetical protein